MTEPSDTASSGVLLAERVARRVAESPCRTAVIDADGAIEYGDFWSRVRQMAEGISGMRRIAVLPTSDIESLVAVVAAMYAGVSVVLLHRHLLPRQLADALTVAAPGAVVAAPKQHRRLRGLGYEDVLHTVDSLAAHSAPTSSFVVAPESELLIGITSGTTGEPKLFVRDQYSWARTLDRSDAVFGIEPGARVATPGVLDHTHFLYGALHAMTRGATVDLRQVTRALSDGATHLYSVPTIAWDVVRSGLGSLPEVREVLSSAARWPAPGRRALRAVLPNATLVHFYGASELSFVSFDRWVPGVEPAGVDEHAAGELFDGVAAEIRDGVVHIRSDMLFDGYLTERGRTGGPVDGWTTVGDRGEVRGRRLRLFGRDSEMLIRAGLNVSPAEIETALLAIPGIVEAACVAVPDPRMGEAPAAAVVTDGSAPSVADLWRQLRAMLPSPSMPVRVATLAQLPRTPRGKLDRKALVELLSRNEGAGPAQ